MGHDSYTQPSFSFGNRCARLAWSLGYCLFFRFSPRSFHAWRRVILRSFGAKVGSGVHVYPNVRIWAPWNLELGNSVGVADGVELYTQGKIVLGNRVTVSQQAYLCTGSHDYQKDGFPLWTAPIQVGENSWIAARAFIHPGVTIGANAIVGACAVVTRDVPAGTIVAGNPAKFVKTRP